MALYGLALEAEKDFELDWDPDRGTERALKFRLRTLDSRVHGYLKDRATRFQLSTDPDKGGGEKADTLVSMNGMHFEIFQFGVAGWDNFLKPNSGGEQIVPQFRKAKVGNVTYDLVREEVVRQFPSRAISDVARKIMKENDLGEDEGKELGSPSSLSEPLKTADATDVPRPEGAA